MSNKKSKVVIVSDVHLGYEHSDHNSFNGFLDKLLQSNDVHTLIILGDFVDMWRRDVSGLFLEFNSILGKIMELKKKIDIYCVAGNHDYHLLQLSSNENPFSNSYPLEFKENIPVLEVEGIKYKFMHGHEFDRSQWPPIIEILCENFSDEMGEIRSNIWTLIQSMGKSIFSFYWYLIKNHNGNYTSYVENLKTPPHSRKNFEISDVEKRAVEHIRKEISVQRLVFGHTHKPFVSVDKSLANSGSWVSDERTFNTYIEIDGTEIRLMQYNKGNISSDFIRDFQF